VSLDAQRTAIVALLGAVPAVGHFHDEEPYGRTQADFQDLYLWDNPDTGKKQLRGWFVRRVRTVERMGGVGRTINLHSWQLRGFMALERPDSGKAFDALIEAMRRAVRTDPTFGGAVQPGRTEEGEGRHPADGRKPRQGRQLRDA
jgi:hypothetical protein